MNALALAGSVVGLGVAGLDPVGALMVVPALAAGARRRVVVLFFAVAGVVTVATGLVLGESVEHVTAWLAGFSLPATVRLALQTAVAIGLGGWAAHRWTHRADPEPEKKSLLTGPLAMSLAGAFWGVSAVTDPSFLTLATLDSGVDSLLASTAIYTGWFLLSQAPLSLVVLALAAGRNSAPLQRMMSVAQRLAAPTATILTGLLALTSALLVVNAVTYLIGGEFWPL